MHSQGLFQCYMFNRLLFEGLVARIKRMTKTGPNTTECNWTTGCSCLVLASVGISWVASCLNYENCKKTGCNQLQLVFLLFEQVNLQAKSCSCAVP